MTGMNIFSRRRFRQRSAGTVMGVIGLPSVIPSSVLGGQGGVASSNRITMVCIGVGWQGDNLVDDFNNPLDEIWNTWIDGFSTTTNDSSAAYPETQEIINDPTATRLPGNSMRSRWYL